MRASAERCFWISGSIARQPASTAQRAAIVQAAGHGWYAHPHAALSSSRGGVGRICQLPTSAPLALPASLPAPTTVSAPTHRSLNFSKVMPSGISGAPGTAPAEAGACSSRMGAQQGTAACVWPLAACACVHTSGASALRGRRMPWRCQQHWRLHPFPPPSTTPPPPSVPCPRPPPGSPKLRPARCRTLPASCSVEPEGDGGETLGPPADISSGLRLRAAAEMICRGTGVGQCVRLEGVGR